MSRFDDSQTSGPCGPNPEKPSRAVEERELSRPTSYGVGPEEPLSQSGAPRDPHRVVLEFKDGAYLKRLIHPAVCETASRCGQCGRDFEDAETDFCYDCKPPIPDRFKECWVEGWFENLTAEELLSGEIELTVDPEFVDDGCVLHITDAAMPQDAGAEAQRVASAYSEPRPGVGATADEPNGVYCPACHDGPFASGPCMRCGGSIDAPSREQEQ